MAQSSRTVSSDRSTEAHLPPGVHVLDLDGAFFFGAAAKFDEAIRPLLVRAQTVILRMDDVSLLDATGTRVLHRIFADARRDKVRVVMCEVQPPVLRVMDQAELIGELGTSNLFASFEGALKNIRSQQPLVFGTHVEQGTFDPQ
jgi:SulP family sulfate permease